MITAVSVLENPMVAPASGKRKASDDGNPLNAVKKRKETSSKAASGNKRKLVNGEEQAGGLVIVRATTSRPSTIPSNNETPTGPPSRPPSRQHSQLPDPATKQSKYDASSSKGKSRDTLIGVREDPQVDEDVRQMESEADNLRRKSRAAESSAGFAGPSFQFPASNHTEMRTRRLNHVDAVQPLNVLETPKQQRNKELRDQGGSRSHGSGRKSSLTMRGKRISSSYETTGVITQPHTSVSDASLYKHIDCDASEPQRARQLLMWSSHRAMTATTSTAHHAQQGKDPPLPLNSEAAQILLSVEEQLIKMLADKKIDTNVYSDGSPTPMPVDKKENDQNVMNRTREVNFTARIEQAKAEDEAWVAVSQFYNSYQASVNEEITRRRQYMASARAKGKQRATDNDYEEWATVDEHELPLRFRGKHGIELARRLLSERTSSSEESKIAQRLSTVEDTLERLYNHAYSAIQTTRTTEDELNRRFSCLNIAVTSSNVLPSMSGHSLSTQPSHVPLTTSRQPTTDPQELLRALSRIDVERPPSQIGDSVRRAMMEVQRVNEASAGATERRLTGLPATPRKTPGTPRRAGTPGKR